MKTNKITKILLAFMAVAAILSMTSGVFAEAGTGKNKKPAESRNDAAGKPSRKDGKDLRMKDRDDDNDDYDFEDFLEDLFKNERKGKKSFSGLPENPTMSELKEYYEKNFADKQTDKKSGKGSESKKDSGNRSTTEKDQPKHRRIDLSGLPEDATDEEILEFVKKYRSGKTEGNGAEKDSCTGRQQPAKPDTAPVTEPAPETPKAAPAEETTAEAASENL